MATVAGVSFDGVAQPYALLERLIFGRALEQCRVSLLSSLPPVRRALFLGEGDGRFLEQYVHAFPETDVDVVEPSGEMIRLARQRVPGSRVQFLQGDALKVELPEGAYDLVVTHFVFDLFEEQDAAQLVEKMVEKIVRAAPQGSWLVSEFHKLHGRPATALLLAAMYAFFRVTTGLQTRAVPDYTRLFTRYGMAKHAAWSTWGGFIVSELWSRQE